MKNTRKRLVDSVLSGKTRVTIYSNTRYDWGFTTNAKIDTGADRSSIDLKLAKALRLRKIGEVRVRSANGRTVRPVYAMLVEINDYVYDIEVSAIDRSKLAYPLILGRLDLQEICEEEWKHPNFDDYRKIRIFYGSFFFLLFSITF